MSLKNVLDKIGEASGFVTSKEDAIANNTCIQCGQPSTEFRDRISVKEYHITGMCQGCQDTFYAGLESEDEDEEFEIEDEL